MSVRDLVDPAGPLLAFAKVLGLPPEVWPEREEPERVTYSNENLSRDVIGTLTLDVCHAVSVAYGAALTCRFLLGDLVVLDIVTSLREEDLVQFRYQTQDSSTLTIEFDLDKTQLLAHRVGDIPNSRLFLYLFPAAVERLLANTVSRLETLLWGADTSCRVIILVPDQEIELYGQSLALLGGTGMKAWSQVVAQPPPNAQQLQSTYRACRSALKWQDTWLQHLTPQHLTLVATPAMDNPIGRALQLHRVNLCILYTADRTVTRGTQWVATYASSQQTADLGLSAGGTAGDFDAAGVDALLQLCAWAYEPAWVSDRLLLVQIVIADALHLMEPTERYRRLIQATPALFQQMQWHWKAIMEGKVESYVVQVRDLEAYVATTVGLFADQVTAIIDSLSTTMLAAVATLLGSFVAALFRDSFNPTVFGLGLSFYAAYVLGFPLGYNMGHQWQKYTVLLNAFSVRRRRFEERLSPVQVQGIIGSQVEESQARFRLWFWLTIVAYVVIVALAIVGIMAVPRLIAGSHAMRFF